MSQRLPQHASAMQAITLLGAVIDIAFALGKIVAGIFGQSKALVVEGLYAFANLLSDCLELAVARLANTAADPTPTYKHQRIETVSTIGLGLFLVVTGSVLAWDGLQHLWQIWQGQSIPPLDPVVFWVALLSIVIKEWHFQYTATIAKTIPAKVWLTAWHPHLRNTLPALVVLIGISGALLGWLFLDVLAALLVALLIASLGIQQIMNRMDGWIDSALPSQAVEEILTAMKSVPGVITVPRLRIRQIGGKRLLDAEILVSPYIRTSESRHIANRIKTVLQEAGLANAVLLYIESAYAPDRLHVLPLRTEIVQTLQQRCAHLPYYNAIEDISLHYDGEQILVELSWPWTIGQERPIQPWTAQYRQALADVPWLKDLRFHFVLRHFGKPLHHFRQKSHQKSVCKSPLDKKPSTQQNLRTILRHKTLQLPKQIAHLLRLFS